MNVYTYINSFWFTILKLKVKINFSQQRRIIKKLYFSSRLSTSMGDVIVFLNINNHSDCLTYHLVHIIYQNIDIALLYRVDDVYMNKL